MNRRTKARAVRYGIYGGTLLVLADTLARTLLAPRQLPVGAITAAVGVPAFLFLLRRSLRSGG